MSDNYKDTLRAWMTLHNISRQQLADGINCTIGSVNAWFSKRPIPSTRRRVIDMYMAAIEAADNDTGSVVRVDPEPAKATIAITIPGHVLTAIERLADDQHITADEYIRQAATDIANAFANALIAARRRQ